MDQQTRNDRNKRKQLLITGLALVFCLGIFAVYQVKQTSVPSDVGPANKIQTTVDVFTVAKADLVKRISLSGQTVPTAEVDIAAKYQGRITGVYVSLGQRVTAGQALVVQDTGDADIAVLENQAAYRQAVAEAQTSAVSFQAAYDRAKADYQRALASYQRYKSLYDMGGISREAFDINSQQLADAKATLDTLANQINSGSEPATVEAARAAAAKAGQAVSAAQKERGDLVLSSPRSGVIGYRMVEVGDLVQAGQKLLSIVDNSNIYVDCQVSEQDMAAMSLGMKVDVQIESLGKSIPGKIIYISPANDPQNLSFSLRIALTSSDPSIRSGMFARAVINAPLRHNALVVPKDAVVAKNGKFYVYVINAKNGVEKRVVQVGARGDVMAEILGGLKDGERIAVNNLARLRSGMIIVPKQLSPVDRGDNS